MNLTAILLAVTLGVSPATYLQHHVNERRLDRGLERLRVDDSLTYCAKQHSKKMVEEWGHSTVEEIGDCVSKVLGEEWTLGEAIGRAYSVEQVWDLLMKSDPHRHLLMQPKWDFITVGVYQTEDMVFATIWVREKST